MKKLSDNRLRSQHRLTDQEFRGMRMPLEVFTNIVKQRVCRDFIELIEDKVKIEVTTSEDNWPYMQFESEIYVHTPKELGMFLESFYHLSREDKTRLVNNLKK